MHRLVKFLLLVCLVLLAGAMLWWGVPLLYGWPQSGFEYIEPEPGSRQIRTLWDWLELLIVPVALGLAAVWFNRSEKRNEITAADKRAAIDRELAEKRAQTEREIAEDNLKETALQGYFDRMSELLLNENLREAEKGSEVRAVARSRTLATLRRLDGERKGSLVRFLMESGLINKQDPIISLSSGSLGEVNLRRADLTLAYLSEADLGGADLTLAKLNGADLSRAYLRGAHLDGAKLNGADLTLAYLSEASLAHADLSGAHLGGAFLPGAYLGGATVTKEQLNTALSLKGATLPDGTKVPDDEDESQTGAGNAAVDEEANDAVRSK